MNIDGKQIAAELLATITNEVSHCDHTPHLTVIICAPDFATKKYVAMKEKQARQVGVGIDIIELPKETNTDEIKAVIKRAAMQTDGIIVQLPLPSHLDTADILATIPSHLDIDGVHYAETGSGFLPPVVGAIAIIAARYDVLLATQPVVVVGQGILVGQPAAVWATNQGGSVTVVTKDTLNKDTLIKQAAILILGAGVPGIVTPEMIRDGVMIFDAGTSEDKGELRGDADPLCAAKCSLFTPVPGGIGPITVAILLQNLIQAAKAQ